MKNAQFIKAVCHVAGLAAVALAAPAHAVVTVTDVTGAGTSLGESHTVTFGSTSARDANLGAWKVNEGSSNASSASSFWVYCLDPLNGFNKNVPGATYDTSSLSSFVTGGGYTTLFAGSKYQVNGIKGKYDDSTTTTTKVLADLKNLYSHAYYDSLTSSVKSAAFQFSIWEILGDGKGKKIGNTNTYDGKYYIDGYTNSGLDINETIVEGNFADQAKAYLDALNSGTWSSVNNVNLSSTTNFTYTVYNPNPAGNSQVLLSVTKDGIPPSQIPEPGSLALAGLALFGVVYTRRQSKSKR